MGVSTWIFYLALREWSVIEYTNSNNPHISNTLIDEEEEYLFYFMCV